MPPPHARRKKPVSEDEAARRLTGLLAGSGRLNDTHIFFWGSPLSNFHRGRAFSGQRCLDLLLPRLDSADHGGPVAHPSPTAFVTLFIAQHHFSCGEQFMMAMKAWLFEEDIEAGRRDCDSMIKDGIQLADLEKNLMATNSTFPAESWQGKLYKSSLSRILRSKDPGDIKSLGRQVKGVSDEVWTQASPAVMVSIGVAKAEVDRDLRTFYTLCGERKFVEGSPRDRVWGVGLKWDNSKILNEENWEGENRLGKCHDEAARITRESRGQQ